MQSRSQLLIRCTKEEAETIRAQAWAEYRTVSSYVLNILHRGLVMEERLFAKLSPPKYFSLNSVLARAAPKPQGPRTAVLIRCSVDEAKRIRLGAGRRELSISRFVLWVLHRSWDASAAVARSHPDPSPRQ